MKKCDIFFSPYDSVEKHPLVSRHFETRGARVRTDSVVTLISHTVKRAAGTEIFGVFSLLRLAGTALRAVKVLQTVA